MENSHKERVGVLIIDWHRLTVLFEGSISSRNITMMILDIHKHYITICLYYQLNIRDA